MADEGFELEELPCAHGGILLEPAAEVLAGKLNRILAALNNTSPDSTSRKIETGKSAALIPS